MIICRRRKLLVHLIIDLNIKWLSVLVSLSGCLRDCKIKRNTYLERSVLQIGVGVIIFTLAFVFGTSPVYKVGPVLLFLNLHTRGTVA
jgi:hypothetical protein